MKILRWNEGIRPHRSILPYPILEHNKARQRFVIAHST
jgi:hypothetical protein